MQFTVAAKTERKEGDYKITRVDTIARWFLWSKVAMDGQVMDKHNDYVAALTKLKKPEYEAAAEFATKLAKAAHDKRATKQANNGSRNLYR
jgi:hypothetical protein